MNRVLNRALAIVPVVAAAAMLLTGPASATTTKKHHVSCSKIRSELTAGKKPSEVASDLNVSEATVMKCTPKVASTKQHSKTHSQSHTAPAQ